tara:strand:+ start:660 stop:1259 length:600 start_codon:yes stop_codon:yes gene_type:complete
MFPSKLVEAVEYLNSLTIEVSENHEDGRVNSIDDEDTVIDLLIEKYGDNVEKPPARCWWDLKLFGYPLNFKSSKFGSAADNFSSKAAILYALTNIPEEEVTCSSWKQFQNKLKENSSQQTPRDYYIIVLNKVTGVVYLQSLKSLNKLTSNGNNLPFQIKWKDNVFPVERTYLQSYDFLIECYKESVHKKISSHDGFEEL